jgi:hypothetical protein
MPTVNLRAAKKNGHAAVERQSPEPRNRMVRREMVHDRRVTKRTLRELIACGEAGRTEYVHRCE